MPEVMSETRSKSDQKSLENSTQEWTREVSRTQRNANIAVRPKTGNVGYRTTVLGDGRGVKKWKKKITQGITNDYLIPV